jgi:hypothetical protein
MLNEQGSLASGSGSTSSGPVTSGRKKGRGGYEYEIFSNGKIQIVSKGGKPLAAPKVLNQAQAIAVAKEQIDLGAGGNLLPRIRDGELVYNPATDPAVATTPVAPSAAPAAPTASGGLILVGRSDYFPVDSMLGLTDNAHKQGPIGKLVGQGHAFAIVVDPKTKFGYRYDFGRYGKASECEDTRWITQKGTSLFGKEKFQQMGLHTMGITKRIVGRVPAKISPDGKRILNLPQFLASTKYPDDTPSEVAVVTVSNPAAAIAYANDMVGDCFPYAIPAFGWLTTRDTMNCGVFAARVLAAGVPNPAFALDEGTILDRPDVMYRTAAEKGYQTGNF